MTPTETDYQYYEWLKTQVDIPNGKTYNDLFERMHNMEFAWTVPNDDNRAQDGLDLRNEFAPGADRKLTVQGATMLEILISLSRRVAFTAGGTPEKWAWHLLKNLRLHKMPDPLSDTRLFKVDEILETVIWRTYARDGRGGFFPLNQPEEDQTKIEIWYQMNKYAIELGSL